MHELAVVHALIDLAIARAVPDRPVREVEIEVGALTGLVTDSLCFYYDCLSPDTALAGSRLICREVPAAVRCAVCDERYEPERFARVCPACGSLGGSVLSGSELNLLRVESDHV